MDNVIDVDKLVCPVCARRLSLFQRTLKCPGQHSFDIAREGYVNLLLPQQKGSLDPGDTREMVLARIEFHKQLYYKPLADALFDLMSKPASLLDIGCGEGSYAAWLLQANPNINYHGVDISRHAIRHAARVNQGASFVVASNWHLPYVNQCFDFVLSIFSPSDRKQLERVLKPEGRWINVTPGENHLVELRTALYANVTALDKNITAKGWTTDDTRSLSSKIILDQASLQHLINMTPYTWRANRRSLDQLRDCHEMSVTVDFRITTRFKGTK